MKYLMKHIKTFLVGLIVTTVGVSLIIGFYLALHFSILNFSRFVNANSIFEIIIITTCSIFIVILAYMTGKNTLDEYEKWKAMKSNFK